MSFFYEQATKRKFSNGPIAQITFIYVNLRKSFLGQRKVVEIFILRNANNQI